MELIEKINEIVIARSQDKSSNKKNDDNKNDPKQNSVLWL